MSLREILQKKSSEYEAVKERRYREGMEQQEQNRRDMMKDLNKEKMYLLSLAEKCAQQDEIYNSMIKSETSLYLEVKRFEKEMSWNKMQLQARQANMQFLENEYLNWHRTFVHAHNLFELHSPAMLEKLRALSTQTKVRKSCGYKVPELVDDKKHNAVAKTIIAFLSFQADFDELKINYNWRHHSIYFEW